MKKIFLLLIFLSFNELFAQNGWQQIPTPTNTSYTFNTIFFVTKDIGFLYYKKFSAQYFRDGVVYMTTNGGSTFSLTTTNVILKYAYFKNANTGWILGDKINYEVPGHYYFTHQTTNGGASWTETEFVSNPNYTNCIKFSNDNTGWKTKSGGGLFKTTNGGTSWDSVATNLSTINPQYFTVNPIDAVNYRLTVFDFGSEFANGSMMYSTNSGINWTQTVTPYVIYSKPHFEFVNGISIMATDDGVLKTTNYGVNWNETGSIALSRDVSSINNQYIWTCERTGNVKFSSNGGNSFINQFSVPANSDSISIFMFPADSLNHVVGYVNFAGKLYKTTTGGQQLVSVQNNQQTMPENFSLSVYPNPFNPSSKIRIENKYSIVSLSISLFDLTGKLIRLITYQNIPTGINEFSIDYTGLPTGSYLLNISDGKLSETKKIVLLK